VTDHDVALRRREMGIRFALGADAARVRRLVVGQALAPLVAGLAAGWLIALWLAPLAQPFLHNVDPRDPWTYAGVAGVLLAAGAIAAWLPASRAARTDPAVVLRAS
jgi:ABC-type lipoprotein release transport system permease subunit